MIFRLAQVARHSRRLMSQAVAKSSLMTSVKQHKEELVMYGTLFGAFAGGLGLYMKLLLQPLEFQIASNQNTLVGLGKELKEAEARQKDALVRLGNLFKDAEMRQGSARKEAEGRQIAALKAQGNELRMLQNIFRTEGYFKSAKAPESKPFIQ